MLYVLVFWHQEEVIRNWPKQGRQQDANRASHWHHDINKMKFELHWHYDTHNKQQAFTDTMKPTTIRILFTLWRQYKQLAIYWHYNVHK